MKKCLPLLTFSGREKETVRVNTECFLEEQRSGVLFNEAKIAAGVFAPFSSFTDLKNCTLNGKPVVLGPNWVAV